MVAKPQLDNMVTFLITSCGRLDLLERTIDSFLKFNQCPIERYIITEDSADPKIYKQCKELNKKYGGMLEFIFNKNKLGQSRTIDQAYSQITTPYVFHCEDDWEFYAGGFIEKSMALLESRPEILQAWIRPKADGILNAINSEVFYTENGIPFRSVVPTSFYTGQVLENGEKETVINYAGFSYNPGLKRMKDYFKLGSGGYSQFGKEHWVDKYYRDLGYRFVSMTMNDQDGYVKHIGWDRRVENTIH